jgi:hypothetical protein
VFVKTASNMNDAAEVNIVGDERHGQAANRWRLLEVLHLVGGGLPFRLAGRGFHNH